MFEKKHSNTAMDLRSLLQHHCFCPKLGARRPATHRDVCTCAASTSGSLHAQLRTLDNKLANSEPSGESEALEILEKLKATGLVRAFGTGHQVPKRAYTLEELRLNRIDTVKFLSPDDKTLNQVRTIVQGAGVLLLVGISAALHLQGGQILGIAATILFALTADQVANGGGFEALAIDAAGRALNGDYGRRVAAHEAGHFMVAYLIGLLPKKYILSSVDAFRRYGALNVQAGTQFCDGDFMAEVSRGKMTSTSLDRYCCIALAGVATEYLLFGQAEGGLNDVRQLDGLLRALQFSQAKADSQVRWAVLNVVEMLRRHKHTHARLADAMGRGSSIGECISVIEEAEAGSSS